MTFDVRTNKKLVVRLATRAQKVASNQSRVPTPGGGTFSAPSSILRVFSSSSETDPETLLFRRGPVVVVAVPRRSNPKEPAAPFLLRTIPRPRRRRSRAATRRCAARRARATPATAGPTRRRARPSRGTRALARRRPPSRRIKARRPKPDDARVLRSGRSRRRSRRSSSRDKASWFSRARSRRARPARRRARAARRRAPRGPIAPRSCPRRRRRSAARRPRRTPRARRLCTSARWRAW